jgi:hypothetical protein
VQPIKYRKLRIALSAVCGIVCLLLVVLWVRSYWWADTLKGGVYRPVVLFLHSSNGRIALLRVANSNPSWRALSDRPSAQSSGLHGAPMWQYGKKPNGEWYVVVPQWFPVLVTGTLVAAPWLRWRFSLRTLLIATTLVAVGLGVAVMVLRGS